MALQCSSVSPDTRAEAGCLAFAPALAGVTPPPPPTTTAADSAANGILQTSTLDASTGYLALASTLLDAGDNATVTLAGNDVAISGRLGTDMSTPLELIGVSGSHVTITLAPSLASTVGGVIAIAQPAPASTNGSSAMDGAESSAEYASDLVSVGLLNTDGRVLESAASMMEAPVELVLGLTQYLPAGGGNCSVSELVIGARPAETTCTAGCCTDDVGCVCRQGYAGEMCEYELRCAIVPAGEASFAPDGSVCLSALMDDGLAMRCTCADVGLITVIRYRLTPANNLQLQPGWIDELWLSVGMAWMPPILLLYLALFAVCAHYDAHNLYVSADAPQLPWWARPAAFDVRAAFVETLLTRSTPLRVIFVVPGHTVYTRAQLLLVLAFTLVAQAFSVMLFFGRDQCSSLAAFMVIVSTLISSIVATIGRLLFRWGNLIGRRKLEYRTRKDTWRNAQLRRLIDKRNDSEGSMVSTPSPGDQGAEPPSDDVSGKRLVLPSSPPPSPPVQSSPPDAEEAGTPTASNHASAPAPTPSAVVPRRDEDTWLAVRGGELGMHMERGRGDTYSQLMIGASKPTAPRRRAAAPILKMWTNQPHATVGEGESSGKELQTDLDVDRLSVGADGYTLGFLKLSDGERSLKLADGSSAPCIFVAALHIGRIGFNRYRVTYRARYRSDVPVAAALVVPNFIDGVGDAPMLLRPGGYRWRIAWAVNAALLFVSAIGVLHLLGSGNDTSSAHYLQASALSQEEWRSKVLVSYLYSVAQSFIIVDGVKVGLIWLTSGPVLQLAFPHGSLRHRLIIKPLRRMHKIVDVVL